MKLLSYVTAIAAILHASAAMAAERVALVIGEASYQSGSTVPKALADSDAIAATLEQLDFETTMISDATRANFVDELAKFSERAAGAEIALLYYSGHGLSVGQDNYLLPADIKLSSDIRIRFEAIALEDAIAALNGAKARLALINMPDSNPYLAGMKLSLNNIQVSDNFAPVDMSGAALYLSQAKTLTAGDDGLSPYATAVIEALAEPGADLGQSLGKASERLASMNLPKPLEYDALPAGIVLLKPDNGPNGRNDETADTGISATAEDECDRLAGDPNDPMKSPHHAGIESDEYISEAALTACQAAVQLHPEDARLQYQTGRALKGLGRYDEGRPYLEKAQRLGSLQARVMLSRYLYGDTGSTAADKEKARRELQDEAAEGATDALLVLGVINAGEKNHQEAIRLYREAYEKGNATAALFIGFYYHAGTAVPKGTEEAVNWFKRAAEKDTGAGLEALGDAFRYDEELNNPAMALKMYLKAASYGSRSRFITIGDFYAEGSGTARDFAEAKKWYLKAGAEGEYRIGELYYYGRGTVVDYGEALSWYRKAADHGYAQAMRDIAIMHENGDGVEADPAASIDWNMKAAEKGNISAMKALGDIYLNGTNVPKDLAQAEKWYSLAAEEGEDSYAMNQVGWVRQNRDPPDYKGAMEWYRKAGNEGNTTSIRNIGWLYQNGKGVKKSDKEALKWYRKAADAGDGVGMNYVGVAYANGAGVTRDDREAGRWYEKAATAGNDYANLNLAILFSRGLGCRQDPELAAQLAEIAIRGDSAARDYFKSDWSNWHPAFLVAFQKRLNKLGLYDGAADGNYGKGTLAAIDALNERGKE
ncbi:caspase family protein [Rhizobium viscosum]|uniref:TPR repeat protein n=1 Tax=Rhizobium viscosum TaxID=1673 RepID=A0ABR9IUL4_RHIVS|nr:caspase family protein [Rhizobium viscosum]MBE1506880.1 TPR repeat protein [Rhizobium viscosum]